MTAPAEYLLQLEGGGGIPAALAEEFGLAVAELTALLAEAPDGRLVLPTAAGPRVLVAARLTAADRGPGAPSTQDRCLEAGLRLGRAAPGGRIWLGDGVDIDGGRGALWRGAYLGSQDPARGRDALPPAFAEEGEPSAWTVARAEAAAWVRALVERPANLLGPVELAMEIADFASSPGQGVTVETWSGSEAEDRGFGAVLAVGGGSSRPPLVMRLSWGDDAAPAPRVLGLVGKGITFDSGGVNLKRDSAELAWMKTDMAAAAAVSAALIVASACQDAPRGSRVEAILPLCDNALSGASMRPGDVVTHPGGERTEVVDTDSEGRLVLADGVSWCRSRGYGRILDVGTLTDGGAGLRRTGLWSNDAELADVLCALGGAVADPLWPLPLPYGESALESRVADQRNAPLDRPDVGRHAAGFLASLAAGTEWAHYDIGGTAYLEQPVGGWSEGATGAPVAALAEAIRDWVVE